MKPHLRLTKSRLFAILMTLAACGALLPVSCTRWAGGVLQPLGWLTSPLVSAGRGLVRSGDALSPHLPMEEGQRLQLEIEAQRRALGHQSLTIANMELRIEELSAIREQLREMRARLRLATVIGYDASPRRETLIIARGSNDGLLVGQWVVACSAPAADAQTGREVVQREWLIGRVSEVFPFVSRVRLATDPQFERERVRVARVLADGTWQVIGSDCLLSGLGGGRMQIEQVTQDLRGMGGEVVLAPASADLPADLTLGKVTGSRTLPDAPLFYNLDVSPWGDVRRLSTVYVIVPGR